MSTTRAQEWSRIAHRCVQDASKKLDDAGRKKYRTSCRKMPGLIHQAGLLQAIVFQVARDAFGKRYVDDLCKAVGDVADHAAFVAKLQEAPMFEYMKLTAALTEIAIWFSRFADIEFADLAEDIDDAA